ncbi:MAG TPA: hypothetical protein PKC30_02130 [Saprospiraceae bacterium]|nr:hypothetical protein [Saprospiraceae bacterium]
MKTIIVIALTLSGVIVCNDVHSSNNLIVSGSKIYDPKTWQMFPTIQSNYTFLIQDSIVKNLFPNEYFPPEDVSVYSDEFENQCSFTQWTHISDTEGWDAYHLLEQSMNENGNGQWVMVPHTTVWFADYKGPFLYKDIGGDFVIDLKLHVTNRNQDNIPASEYSLAGIMLRTPKNITGGTNDWVEGQENYIFISTGFASTGHPSCPSCPAPHFEIKNTTNSNSILHILPVNSQIVVLKAVRITEYILVFYSTDDGSTWTVAGRFHRQDMPEVLQAGIVTYTDWNKASTYTPLFQNNNDLIEGMMPDPSSNSFIPFHPDLRATFDYFRVQHAVLPDSLSNVDLTDSFVVEDSELISIFGQRVEINPMLEEVVTWNGQHDDDWMNAMNWNGNTVPGEQSRVLIPDLSCNDLHSPVLNTTIQLRSLIISEQGQLTIESDGHLTISDQEDHYTYLFMNEGIVYVSGILQINVIDHPSINKGHIEVLTNGELILSQ